MKYKKYQIEYRKPSEDFVISRGEWFWKYYIRESLNFKNMFCRKKQRFLNELAAMKHIDEIN